MCPAYDSAPFYVQVVLCCSQFRLLPVTIHTYPVFVPNEYLYTHYKRTLPQGQTLDRAEVYAEAMRDFLANEGGYGLTN